MLDICKHLWNSVISRNQENNVILLKLLTFGTFFKVHTHSSSSVRNLGVRFDSNLSFDSHVSSVCKTEFFHLKNISKLRPMLSMSNVEMLIHAFMTSSLDYCYALLGGCSACLINKLQMVQNVAARVLTRTRKYDHICPVLSTRHWLPIKHRIDFKILLITYKALNGLSELLCIIVLHVHCVLKTLAIW